MSNVKEKRTMSTSSSDSDMGWEGIQSLMRDRAHKLETEEEFIEAYRSDPFFRAKVDYKIEEAKKKLSKYDTSERKKLMSSPKKTRDYLSLQDKCFAEEKSVIQECIHFSHILENHN